MLNRGPEPFHRVFALPGRLAGVLAPIVQVFVVTVLRCRHRGPVSDLVTASLSVTSTRGRRPCFFTIFLENLVAATVPLALDQNVENVPVLIHRSPQILSCSADVDEHFVQMSRVTRTGCPLPQPAGAFGPEYGTGLLTGAQPGR